jgi:hypothetical protein
MIELTRANARVHARVEAIRTRFADELLRRELEAIPEEGRTGDPGEVAAALVLALDAGDVATLEAYGCPGASTDEDLAAALSSPLPTP